MAHLDTVIMYTPAYVRPGSKLNAAAFWEYISGFGYSRRVVRTHHLNDKPGFLLVRMPSTYHVGPRLAATKNVTCIFDDIHKDDLDLVRKGTCMLLIDMGIEAFFAKAKAFKQLHESLRRLELPPSGVVLMNNNLASGKAYHHFCLQNGIEDRVTILQGDVVLWLFALKNKEARSDIDPALEPLRDRIRPKRFISFNGRYRPHRFYVVLYMCAKGWLDRSFVSMLAYQGAYRNPHSTEEKAVFEARLRSMEEQFTPFPYASEALPHLEELMRRLPLELDVPVQTTQANATYYESVWSVPPWDYYKDTYFSIVTDTSFFDSSMLLVTEKVFKSFARLSPFVFFGNPGSLAVLRDMGFRTFAPLIDESYDTVPDHFERLRLGLTELERLAGLTDDQAAALYREVWPILIHNYNHMHHGLMETYARRIEANILNPLTKMLQ